MMNKSTDNIYLWETIQKLNNFSDLLGVLSEWTHINQKQCTRSDFKDVYFRIDGERQNERNTQNRKKQPHVTLSYSQLLPYSTHRIRVQTTINGEL